MSDVFSAPGLVSLLRVPLAVAFPFTVGHPAAALVVLAAAGLSDVLDGWCARHWGRTTVTGALLDPLVDKVFVATVTITLLVSHLLSLPLVLLLGARDVLELPLVVWMALNPGVFADRERVKANAAGKAATVLQFTTIAAAFLAPEYAVALAIASAASGIAAAGSYWARMLRRARATPSSATPSGGSSSRAGGVTGIC